MNDRRSPPGRSLTSPSPAGHWGHLPLGTFNCLVEIWGSPGEPRDAIGMGVESQVVRESLGNWEPMGERDRGQLSANLSSCPRTDGAVFHAQFAPESNLETSARTTRGTLVVLARTFGDIPISEPSGEGFKITFECPSKLDTVDAIREIERLRIRREFDPIPDGGLVEISELQT